MSAFDARQFGDLVGQEFPELRDALARGGDVFAAVDEFAQYTQSAKIAGDWPRYERCVQVADRTLAEADPALAEAFRDGFFGHLDFEGSRGPAAWQLLTPRLQAAWKQMDAENRRLMALPQQRARGGMPAQREERRNRPRGPKPKAPRGPGGPKGNRGPRGRRGPRGGGGRGGGRGGR